MSALEALIESSKKDLENYENNLNKMMDRKPVLLKPKYPPKPLLGRHSFSSAKDKVEGFSRNATLDKCGHDVHAAFALSQPRHGAGILGLQIELCNDMAGPCAFVPRSTPHDRSLLDRLFPRSMTGREDDNIRENTQRLKGVIESRKAIWPNGVSDMKNNLDAVATYWRAFDEAVNQVGGEVPVELCKQSGIDDASPVFVVVYYKDTRILHIISNSGLPYVQDQIITIFESHMLPSEPAGATDEQIAKSTATLVIVHGRDSYWIVVVACPGRYPYGLLHAPVLCPWNGPQHSAVDELRAVRRALSRFTDPHA